MLQAWRQQRRACARPSEGRLKAAVSHQTLAKQWLVCDATAATYVKVVYCRWCKGLFADLNFIYVQASPDVQSSG